MGSTTSPSELGFRRRIFTRPKPLSEGGGVRPSPSAAISLSACAKRFSQWCDPFCVAAPEDTAPYTHFGPAARRSAGFQPAVSQGFQPAGLSSLPTRPQPPPAVPIGNRRPAPKAFGVHRLETCATSAHEMRVRCSEDVRYFLLGDWDLGILSSLVIGHSSFSGGAR